MDVNDISKCAIIKPDVDLNVCADPAQEQKSGYSFSVKLLLPPRPAQMDSVDYNLITVGWCQTALGNTTSAALKHCITRWVQHGQRDQLNWFTARSGSRSFAVRRNVLTHTYPSCTPTNLLFPFLPAAAGALLQDLALILALLLLSLRSWLPLRDGHRHFSAVYFQISTPTLLRVPSLLHCRLCVFLLLWGRGGEPLVCAVRTPSNSQPTSLPLSLNPLGAQNILQKQTGVFAILRQLKGIQHPPLIKKKKNTSACNERLAGLNGVENISPDFMRPIGCI